jgi:hypothetical protein
MVSCSLPAKGGLRRSARLGDVAHVAGQDVGALDISELKAP